MPCKKAKKSGGKKKKPCLCRAEDSDINAELFGGGIKTVSCQLAPRLMLPKEVKNSHIAEGKNPVEPKERDYKALCDFNEFFHGYASSVKIKSERKIISSSPTKGFINSTVRIRSPGRTSGTPE